MSTCCGENAKGTEMSLRTNLGCLLVAGTCVRHQRSHRDPQGKGESLNVQKRDIPLSTLDATYIRAVKGRFLRELLLRYASLFAQPPETVSETHKDVSQEKRLQESRKNGRLIDATLESAYDRSTSFKSR